MKKISIIIPAYNEEEALPALMERITKFADDTKDYDFEFLFVNDGSKDRTIELIKEYREKDKRVCYVDFEKYSKIVFIMVFAKNSMENLSQAECNHIKILIDRLEKQIGGEGQ